MDSSKQVMGDARAPEVVARAGVRAPDAIAFLFAIDPVTERESYVRAGRYADLTAEADRRNARGQVCFVLPQPMTQQEIDTRFDRWLDRPDPAFPFLRRRDCIVATHLDVVRRTWHAALRA